jgi:hypothetical protein
LFIIIFLLQMDWIAEEETLIEYATNQTTLHKEQMKQISVLLLYIDKNLHIVSHNKTALSCSPSGITNDVLMRCITKHQTIPNNNTKYKLDSALLYNVTIEQDNLQSYVNSPTHTATLHPVNIFDNQPIEPSIALFHPINELILIYKELSSILKSGSSKNGEKKSRRRVNIEEHKNNITKHNR